MPICLGYVLRVCVSRWFLLHSLGQTHVRMIRDVKPDRGGAAFTTGESSATPSGELSVKLDCPSTPVASGA